jgi:iron(II)-dependent oxidoreductase
VDLTERIHGELEAARRRTLGLLEPVPQQDWIRQHSTLMSPLVWDLAHIAHYEELWLVRELTAAPPTDPRFDDVYDAFRHPRAERPALELLGPDEARSFAADVRARALDVLDRADLDDGPLLHAGFVYGMVAQHEHQHDETMLATLQLRDRPYPVPTPEPAARKPPCDFEVFVPAGTFSMGESAEAWAYDNERPAHDVDVAAFWIDTTPVTNGAYLEFVEEGGYDDPRWWSPAGWKWRQEGGLTAPQFWRRAPDRSWTVRRFGHTIALDPAEPVEHVCWYEADAYARFRGRRLPTEAEWEKAARWDGTGSRRYPWGDAAPGDGHANLGQRRFGPAPVGSFPEGISATGCHQMLGDVWEWTASDFGGYPGFRSFPYREYSEVFFGSEYKVLRGGSWATHPVAIRGSFRNWDYPIRRQIFAGFRCARDA